MHTSKPQDIPRRIRGDYENDDGQDSTSIVSYPQSVQHRLDQAREMLNQNRPQAALATLQQAGVELARSSPELYTLALIAQTGGRELIAEEQILNSHSETVERTLFGIRYGSDTTTTTHNQIRRRTLRIG